MWRILAILSVLVCGYAGRQILIGRTLRFTTGNANVRAEPTVEAEIVTFLGRGGRVTADSAGAEWTRVVLSDGHVGYVASRLLDPPPSPRPWIRVISAFAPILVLSCMATSQRPARGVRVTPAPDRPRASPEPLRTPI